MTLTQGLVIAIGLVSGYGLVTALSRYGRKTPGHEKGTDDSSDNSAWKEREPVRPPPYSVRQWPEVLGIGESAEVSEIKLAYKSMMSQYHPDKVASLGLELRNLAELKSKAITNAYREAMRERGLKV
jgi:DnaJ like chaperone protein